MKRFFLFTIALGLFILAGCSNQNNEKQLTVDELKEKVQAFTDRSITAKSASITSTQLVVVDEKDNETVYGLPEDEFFVSIAPFVTTTHPCEIHSLTGCQGELVNSEFDVYITDKEGNVVVDDKMKTGENGFLDLWLPRDETYDIKVTHDGKSVQSEIATFEKDGTCITTLQLT